MTAEKGDLQTTLRAFPGEQKLLPTCISPGGPSPRPAAVGIYCLGRAQRDGSHPPSSLAFPPPLISFGFSPLIKFLACRYV